MPGEPRSPYDGLSVVELAEEPAGEKLGQLMATLGAGVVKVEPPGGAAGRRVGPFAGDRPHPDRSLHFWHYNRGKRSVVLDVAEPAGRRRLDALLATADVLIAPDTTARIDALGLAPDALVAAHPRLVVAAVTPFGLDGPWRDHLACDLVSLAAGGPLASCGYDDHAIPPIRPGGEQAAQPAAAYGHIGVLLALLERRRTGRGQVVDVSVHESLAVTVELANPFWTYQRALVQRQTCRHALPERTTPMHFRCADGRYVHINLLVLDLRAWRALAGWLADAGAAADLAGPEYEEVAVRHARQPHVHRVVSDFLARTAAATAYHEGQLRQLPIGILNAPEDLLSDGHLAARGFFVEVDTGEPDVGTVRFPGVPFRFSAFPARDRDRAPRLGEHDAEVLTRPE